MGDDKGSKTQKKAADNVEEQASQLVGGPLEERGCTDILCCLIFIAWNIFMIVLAVDGVSNGEPKKLVAVYDSSYLPCGIKTNSSYDLTDYKYVYFQVPHPDWLNKTTCVKSCPSFKDNDEKLKKYPNGLSCNTKNQTDLVDYGCKEVCGPFATSDSSTSTLGWSITSGINWSRLFCIYNTKVLANRICFPGASIFTFVKGLSASITNSMNMNQLTSWLNDVDKGINIIYASFGIVFALGIIYMLFVRIFSGVIVWLVIICYFVLLALLGIYLYEKSQEIDQAIKDNDGREEGSNTEQSRDTYLYVAYAVGILWLLCLIGLFCMWNNIRLAIAVIKTATIFTIQTPTSMLISPVMAIITIVWWIVWVIFFVHVLSVGEIQKSSASSIFATVTHKEQQKYFIWCFIFGGLWVNAFCQALTQFLLASTVSIWYFAQPDGNAHRPVFRSVYRAFRYHLGSLAFGSFILAVVQTIRLMLEYIYKQTQASGADENKVVKYILKCLRCCLACFERFIKFLNKNAYIQIALSGENFCTSAKQGMKMVWNNASRVALVSGLGAAFVFVGKVFMICANLFICYMIYTKAEPYKTEMENTFLPLLIIFIISWGVSTIFMSVYGMAIDTILMCFLYDEEQNKGNMDGKMRAPSTLKEFFSDHDSKVEDKQKREKAKLEKQK